LGWVPNFTHFPWPHDILPCNLHIYPSLFVNLHTSSVKTGAVRFSETLVSTHKTIGITIQKTTIFSFIVSTIYFCFPAISQCSQINHHFCSSWHTVQCNNSDKHGLFKVWQLYSDFWNWLYRVVSTYLCCNPGIYCHILPPIYSVTLLVHILQILLWQ
jgi:hypothetical protein